METTADRGRRVRQRLLTTAAALIAERGWAAVSTRMIAERAGVAGGVVHYHFASVQALLREAAMAAITGLLDQMIPVLASAATADEALALMLGGLDDYDGRDPTSLLFTETYLAATRDETLRHDLGDAVDRFRQALADRLAAAGVPAPQATAAVLAATVDGVVLHRALRPGLSTADLLPVLRRLITAHPASVHAQDPISESPALGPGGGGRVQGSGSGGRAEGPGSEGRAQDPIREGRAQGPIREERAQGSGSGGRAQGSGKGRRAQGPIRERDEES